MMVINRDGRSMCLADYFPYAPAKSLMQSHGVIAQKRSLCLICSRSWVCACFLGEWGETSFLPSFPIWTNRPKLKHAKKEWKVLGKMLPWDPSQQVKVRTDSLVQRNFTRIYLASTANALGKGPRWAVEWGPLFCISCWVRRSSSGNCYHQAWFPWMEEHMGCSMF